MSIRRLKTGSDYLAGFLLVSLAFGLVPPEAAGSEAPPFADTMTLSAVDTHGQSPVGIYPASKASERGRLHPASPVEGATRAPIIDWIASGAHWSHYVFAFAMALLALLVLRKGLDLSRLKGPLFGVAVILGLRYLYWRGAYTLNTDDPLNAGLSLSLFLAELLGFFTFLLFCFQTARPTTRYAIASKGDSLPSVDVLVTVSNHSLDMLYRTLVGCRAMDYPASLKTVLVLDDGHRAEVRQLSERLGCRYLTLPSDQLARGTLFSHALERSSSDLVVVFGSGHVPISDFLRKTVGFFSDPRLAFLQIPWHTLSPDPFQQALFLTREIAHEQELFNKAIQPGLDRYEASVAASSGIVYRRTALNEISGPTIDSPGLDLDLSASLHSRGWHSVYLNQNLALRTVADSPDTFWKTRAGRIRQAFRLLIKGVPFWSGLTSGQRAAYLGLALNELQALPRIVFLIAPLGFLLGFMPIVATPEALLAFFIPFFLWQIAATYLFAGGSRHPLWSSVYETADIAAVGPAILGGVGDHRSPGILQWLSAPARFLFALEGIQLAGLAVGLVLHFQGVITWQPLLLGGLWVAYNLILLMPATAAARGRTQKRETPRLYREMDCRLIAASQAWRAKTVDLSETGMSLKMDSPVTLPRDIVIELATEEPVELTARVIRNEAFPWGGASIGVRFGALSDRQRETLMRWLYCLPKAWEEPDRASRTHTAALSALLTAFARASITEGDLHRSSPRYSVAVACRLVLRDRVLPAVTIDASATGVSIRIEEDPGPLPNPSGLEVTVRDRTLSLRGQPVWSRRENDAWKIGLHLGEQDGLELINAVLPLARIKVVLQESLQARILRSVARTLAYAFSLTLSVLVVIVFIRTGTIPFPSRPDTQTVYRFFWLSVFFILADGVKVYLEIAHRAPVRRYESDPSEVTAVIPCHNTGKVLDYTIDGLRRFLSKDRIIVVDDASTDNTAEIARRAGVRVVQLKENVGKARAVGIGLQEVRTRYTLILDDDTRIQSMFLPTSLLEEGNTGVAFYVLPCRRTREHFDGRTFVSSLQRYEYAKSMEIGKRFQDKTLSVSCISGAVGLFKTERLRRLQPFHSTIFPAEDLERTLIDLIHGGRIAFVNEPVWTIAPDNWKDLTRQRLFTWYPGFYRLFPFYVKILLDRTMPGRLRFEMLYNLYVALSDPIKVYSFLVLVFNQFWAGLAFLYFFYLALEIYPFLSVEKKLPVLRYYLPGFLVFPVYGIYNTFLRFASLFVWLWHRFVTEKWKPRREAAIVR